MPKFNLKISQKVSQNPCLANHDIIYQSTIIRSSIKWRNKNDSPIRE